MERNYFKTIDKCPELVKELYKKLFDMRIKPVLEHSKEIIINNNDGYERILFLMGYDINIIKHKYLAKTSRGSLRRYDLFGPKKNKYQIYLNGTLNGPIDSPIRYKDTQKEEVGLLYHEGHIKIVPFYMNNYEKEKVFSFNVNAKNPRSFWVYNGRHGNSYFFDKTINKMVGIKEDEIISDVEFSYYIDKQYIKKCTEDQSYNNFESYMKNIELLKVKDI